MAIAPPASARFNNSAKTGCGIIADLGLKPKAKGMKFLRNYSNRMKVSGDEKLPLRLRSFVIIIDGY